MPIECKMCRTELNKMVAAQKGKKIKRFRIQEDMRLAAEVSKLRRKHTRDRHIAPFPDLFK